MITDFLKSHIESQASVSKGGFVEVGYGQVEPNHLSAQYTGQIYAQLPADPSIEILENGQFVKYDYAANINDSGMGVVNFTGKGEWMLVYNEIKLYRDFQRDCEFAMIKDNYQARVYSPLDGTVMQEMYGPTRFLQGKREKWNGTEFEPIATVGVGADGKPVSPDGVTENAADFSVASTTHDYWEMDNINSDPSQRLFMKLRDYKEKMMPAGTSMVPRVFKTNIGDIFTTNMIKAAAEDLTIGKTLTPGEKGILEITENTDGMLWQVVKVYTMPDHQKGVKLMRIA